MRASSRARRLPSTAASTWRKRARPRAPRALGIAPGVRGAALAENGAPPLPRRGGFRYGRRMMTRNATLIGFLAILFWSLLALFTAATGTIPPFQLAAMTFLVG